MLTVTPVGSSTSIEPDTSTGTPMILIGLSLTVSVGSFVLLSTTSIGVASAGSVVSPYHSTFTPDPLSFNLYVPSPRFENLKAPLASVAADPTGTSRSVATNSSACAPDRPVPLLVRSTPVTERGLVG